MGAASENGDKANEAITELFSARTDKHRHIIVERIVADSDDMVKKVRFPGWQHTTAGERLVQKELRRTLLKFKVLADQELCEKAHGYIRQYYGNSLRFSAIQCRSPPPDRMTIDEFETKHSDWI